MNRLPAANRLWPMSRCRGDRRSLAHLLIRVVLVASLGLVSIGTAQQAPASEPPGEIETSRLSSRISELSAQEAGADFPDALAQELALLRDAQQGGCQDEINDERRDVVVGVDERLANSLHRAGER